MNYFYYLPGVQASLTGANMLMSVGDVGYVCQMIEN